MPPKGKKPKPHKPTEPDVTVAATHPPSPKGRSGTLTMSPIYRLVETVAFVAAILQLLGYMTVELLHRAGVIQANQAHEGFPWGTLIGSVILISPKLIGRAFAGRALVAISGGQAGVGVTAERETGGA